jgi:hypothetical protein
MKFISRIPIFICISLFALQAYAGSPKNNGRVTGYIIDSSGSPLRDAIVKIFREVQQGESLLVARSDSKGFFKSASLRPGTYYLQISRHGYQPVTTGRFAVDQGRSIALDIILQDVIDYLSKNDDPRNMDLKSVMRSSSKNRHIFQYSPDAISPDREDGTSPFYRSAAMSVASNTSLSGKSYQIRPQTSQSGVSSNFALAEPISQKGRMILTGQLDFGYGSFWRLRDTYHYRSDKDHDYRISVGYGRMNVNYPGSNSIPSQLVSQESGIHESGVQTLAFGVEGNTRVFDVLAIKYGFDYSRLHCGMSRSFFYPSIQILLSPADGFSVGAFVTSQRLSDTNTVTLADGEVLNLAEPTFITMIDNQVSMSQIRHSEVVARKIFDFGSAVEVAIFQDRMHGPGLPLMVTAITSAEQKNHVVEMGESNSSQRGMRVTIKHEILDSLIGSVAYAYGNAINISNEDQLVPHDRLEESLTSYMHEGYQHSITSQLDAVVPVTKTNILATLRWYSRNPLTPVDWFSDRMDIGSKSVNFEIRQSVPVPELFGTTGRWEALVDLRNILNQGREVLPATDGEIVLNRNPRSLRFGLSLSFH